VVGRPRARARAHPRSRRYWWWRIRIPLAARAPAQRGKRPTSPVLVRRSSVRFLASKRQIKEKWLHVHIDFCPQFAGRPVGWVEKRAAGSEGRGEGSGACWSVEGGRREGDHQSLRPPTPPRPSPTSSSSSSSSFSSSSFSSSSASRSLPLCLLPAHLYWPRFSRSFSISLPSRFPSRPASTAFLPPSFSVAHPSTPSPACQPVVRSLSLLSPCFPFLFPRSPSSLPLPPGELRPRLPRSPSPVPCPLSPSVCLASSFPSFIPSRAPLVLFFVSLAPSGFTFYSLFVSIGRLSLSLSHSFSVSLSFSVPPFLLFRRARPSLLSVSSSQSLPDIIPLRRYFELSLFLPFRIHSV